MEGNKAYEKEKHDLFIWIKYWHGQDNLTKHV